MNFYILDSAENTASYGKVERENDTYSNENFEFVLEEKFGDVNEIGSKADFHTTLLLDDPTLAFIVSQNMVNKIGELLIKNGELHPIKIIGRKQKFYRYDCTNIVDCLDYEKSTYEEIKLSFFNKKIVIRKPVFINEKIDNNIMFMIPKDALPNIYVTEEFRNIVIKNNITGIKLMKDEYDFDGWES